MDIQALKSKLLFLTIDQLRELARWARVVAEHAETTADYKEWRAQRAG